MICKRALRRPVCQRERVDLSTRAAGEAKLCPFLWSPRFVQPGSGCWLSSLVVLEMTGLMNSASAGDPLLDPRLCDPTAAIEPEFAAEPQPASEPQPDPEAWRREVAARLARYRTRRKPRAPRYPSLLLPFDARDTWSRPTVSTANETSDASAPVPEETSTVAATATAMPFDICGKSREEAREESEFARQAEPQPAPLPEPSAKIIEFPRSAAIPIVHASPLADPIFDRPRIVEAPEIVPPAPALGGILIEPAQSETSDRSADAESLIPAASIPRRLLATGVDAAILAAALSVFAAIFLRFNPVRGPLPLLAGAAGVLAVLLWMSYQFLFIVYIGSTPGLRAAGLKLTKFDGSPVARSTRRWRVLASFLSGISASLGYLWCFLDQDSLCWHDRITRTHIQSAGPAQ